MASTILPVAAFDYCKRGIKNMPLEQIQTRLLDDVAKIMWMAAPWRWTIGTTSAITITSNTQDYTLIPPTDFLFLLDSYVTDGTNTTNHLEVVPALPAAVTVKGVPAFISYQGSNTFRISPNPGTQITPAKQIISTYKKKATTITASNQMTPGTLVFDDEYFPVYVAGVLWLSYLYGDDQRAGSCSIDAQGRASYTGQKGIFEAGLASMRMQEPLPIFKSQATVNIREEK